MYEAQARIERWQCITVQPDTGGAGASHASRASQCRKGKHKGTGMRKKKMWDVRETGQSALAI